MIPKRLISWPRRLWRALSAPSLRAAAVDLESARILLQTIYNGARAECWSDDQRHVLWMVIAPASPNLTPEQVEFAMDVMCPIDALTKIAQVEPMPAEPRSSRELLADEAVLVGADIFHATTRELLREARCSWDALRPRLDAEIERAEVGE